MCGDIESDESLAEEYYVRFIDHTRRYLATLPDEGQVDDPVYAYLDTLFRNTLRSAAELNRAPEEVSGYDRLSMEPLVYARLAGFMAAHQPLQEDPLKRLIEALMTGYTEGEAIMTQQHGHDHSSDHRH